MKQYNTEQRIKTYHDIKKDKTVIQIDKFTRTKIEQFNGGDEEPPF